MMTPTMREVKVILGNENISGFNDRRTYGGRIKLMDRLDEGKRNRLQTILTMLFPKISFRVVDYTWKQDYLNNPWKSTAIYYNL